jgi:serine/threonine-protein kinase
MVIDDEEHLARMFASALQQRGYECEAVSDPNQALRRLEQGHFPLIVADIVMPGLDGVALVRRIKAIKPNTRVIFVTGHATVQHAVAAMKLGADDFLTKPFEIETLCRRVAAAAEKVTQLASGPDMVDAPDTNYCPNLPGYQVIKRIGTGSMGSVFQAQQVALGRMVAVKVIRSSLFTDSTAFYRFMREARAGARMNHSNIIQVYDFVRKGAFLYLVMEHFASRPLSQIVDRAGKLPWREALRVASQVARALGHAGARGIVHRDLKPANILVGKHWKTKLTDFGLAKHTSIVHDSEPSEAGTRVGAVVGTPAYLSPEQALAMPSLDVRSDIYSLGICLFFMLEGRPPFAGNVAELIAAHARRPLPALTAPDLPPALPDILDRMTRKNREERFPSPLDLMRALRQVQDARGLESDPMTLEIRRETRSSR